MEIRNLISITDFSVEEIDKMIGVAGDIMKTLTNTSIFVRGRNWQRYSLNQAHVQDLALKLRC